MNYNGEFIKDDYFFLVLRLVDNLEIYRKESAGVVFLLFYVIDIV